MEFIDVWSLEDILPTPSVEKVKVELQVDPKNIIITILAGPAGTLYIVQILITLHTCIWQYNKYTHILFSVEPIYVQWTHSSVKQTSPRWF